MEKGQLLSIGEFARQTGLTEKALRLYDRKGLLSPASVDPRTGYRHYAKSQIADGRLIAMMRAIDMPLSDIADVLAAPAADQPALIGQYWYRIERFLDHQRRTVQELRSLVQEKEYGMSQTEIVIDRGLTDGAFEAIRSVAEIADPSEAAVEYGEAMKTAYWENKNLALATALAYAGAGQLLSAAGSAGQEASFDLKCRAKALMYDLASFTWVGWGEPGLLLTDADASAGLGAAQTNLAMAVELGRGDLAVSRAYWMLGAHLLTSGIFDRALTAFDSSREFSERAGARAEAELAVAFDAVTRLARGEDGADAALSASMSRLEAIEGGDIFVGQVSTVLEVMNLKLGA